MGKKIRILLLEDDPFHRGVLAEGLEEYYGYEADRAESPEQAEALLSKRVPDLLVLDCVMGGDRLRVVAWAKELRRRPELSKIPILFVTAFFREMEEQVRGIDRSTILSKPFSFDDFIQKVRELTPTGGR